MSTEAAPAAMRRRSFSKALLALPLGGALGAAWAASPPYPSRTVRIVVPFSPGGAPDVIARLLANQWTTALGQPFIVDNKAGANGTIGTDNVAKAAADGYTLLLHGPSFAINPAIYKKLAFNTETDLAPITEVCATPGTLLVVNANTPVTSVKELVAAARKPGANWSYGSPGVGNAFHLVTEQFLQQAKVDGVHVPYKGAGEVVSALLAGDIQFVFASAPGVAQQIKAGRLRALAFTSDRRSVNFPEVPTMAEAGVSGVEMSLWYGLFAPAGTPADIVERIGGATRTALADPKIREQLALQSMTPIGSEPETFKRLVQRDTALYRDLAKKAGIVPE